MTRQQADPVQGIETQAGGPGLRRLLLLVSALVLVDTMLYSALTPLLPHLRTELGLSKTRAGVMVAAYGVGALLGGLPGGIAASRLGPRRAILVGLATMAGASIGFAFAGGFWALFLARLVQGVGSGFTWAGSLAWLLAVTPKSRRGETMGTALGAAVFGALFGPVVGVGAAVAGRGPIFAALAFLTVGLAVWALRLEPAPAEALSLAAVKRALANAIFGGGIVMMIVPSLLFGVLAVLAPLHLANVGWGATAIGAVWLVSAALEAVEAPLVGRWSDRRGHLPPISTGLALGAVCSVALAAVSRPLLYAALVIGASLAWGSLFTPAFSLIAHGADHTGLSQGMAFGFMNAGWAFGAMAGPLIGGALAGATSDAVPYGAAAAICAVGTAATLSLSRRRSRLT